MERRWTLLSAALGAGLMYVLDPDKGRRRRALLRDRAVHLSHQARRALALGTRDLANRTRGLVARTRRGLAGPSPDDDVLAQRVRARIGHVVSHPHSIHVAVGEGCVTLQGPILAGELERCLEAVASVPGVETVASDLEPHASADIQRLQGGAPRRAPPPIPTTPASQLLVVACGVGCALWGARRKDFLGAAVRTLGLAAIAGELAGNGAVQELIERRRRRAARVASRVAS